MKVGIVGSGFVGVTAGYALPLNKQETAGLRDSAGVIRKALDELGEG
jgi:glycine/D-amino acid oxidase-like deaminating enzyme